MAQFLGMFHLLNYDLLKNLSLLVSVNYKASSGYYSILLGDKEISLAQHAMGNLFDFGKCKRMGIFFLGLGNNLAKP